ncbi:MAG: hypothetical protein DRI54_00595 [Bacteroidetes bacterium]|nr:MAG: hypothetical protein DRI54_00595 [Bacteroidota bacterium]
MPVIFFFNKAKNTSIAIAMVLFFNEIKGGKNKLKKRKAKGTEYKKRNVYTLKKVSRKSQQS